MIPARKNAFLDAVCYFFLLRSMRKAFHSVQLRGSENIAALDFARPVIAFSNHTNWWDGFLVFFLTRHLPRSVYAMMEEKQLVQYQFFAWFGAFGVDLTSARASLPGVRYAIQRLQDPRNLVWIFPQGKIVSPHAPIQSQPGTAFLARKAPNAQLLPVAFRYEFFREDKPLILIDIGKPFDAVAVGASSGSESDPGPGSRTDSDKLSPAVGSATLAEQLIQEKCSAQARSLSEVVLHQDLTDFRMLLAPRWSINKRWDWFRHAITGRLKEFRPEN